MKNWFFGSLAVLFLAGCGASSADLRISGRVSCASGQHMAGVSLALTAEDGSVLSAQTAADGSFLFDGLQPGAYKINVSKASTDYKAGVDQKDLDALGSQTTMPAASKWQSLAVAEIGSDSWLIDGAILKKINSGQTVGLAQSIWRFAKTDISFQNGILIGEINQFDLGKVDSDLTGLEFTAAKYYDINLDYCQ